MIHWLAKGPMKPSRPTFECEVRRNTCCGIRRLHAVLLASLVIAACKPEAAVVRVEIVDAGPSDALKTSAERRLTAPGTTEGSVGTVHDTTVFPGGTDLCAQVGTSFGMHVLVHSAIADWITPLVTRVTHPPITDPVTSKQTTVEEWDSPMDSGTPRYAGWAFEKPAELVPGRWRIDILRDGVAVAGRDFTIRLCPDPWLSK